MYETILFIGELAVTAAIFFGYKVYKNRDNIIYETACLVGVGIFSLVACLNSFYFNPSTPAKISVQPSIGATRAEFDKTFKLTMQKKQIFTNYNDDSYLVQFFDRNTLKETEKSTERAYMIAIQPLKENNYLRGINLREFFPSDATTISENKYSDEMVIYYEAEGHSEELEKIFPTSNGIFGVGFNFDKATGKFLGGTVSVSTAEK